MTILVIYYGVKVEQIIKGNDDAEMCFLLTIASSVIKKIGT